VQRLKAWLKSARCGRKRSQGAVQQKDEEPPRPTIAGGEGGNVVDPGAPPHPIYGIAMSGKDSRVLTGYVEGGSA